MKISLLQVSLLLVACSAGDGQSNAQQTRESEQPLVMTVPANSPVPDRNEVIGATPGPCGSTRATAFLGRAYTPELNTALRRASGAVEVRIIPAAGETAPAQDLRDRRLNVYLNDFGQIIMFDCG